MQDKRKKATRRDGITAAEKDIIQPYHHPTASSSNKRQLELGELVLSLVRPEYQTDRVRCLQFLQATLDRHLRLRAGEVAA